MIISKTPFRISFVGGGSDHFNKNSEVPGRVICTTINKYMYISVNKKHDNKKSTFKCKKTNDYNNK